MGREVLVVILLQKGWDWAGWGRTFARIPRPHGLHSCFKLPSHKYTQAGITSSRKVWSQNWLNFPGSFSALNLKEPNQQCLNIPLNYQETGQDELYPSLTCHMNATVKFWPDFLTYVVWRCSGSDCWYVQLWNTKITIKQKSPWKWNLDLGNASF